MKRNSAVTSAVIALSALSMRADDPTVYAVSDAHLDTQWNWDVQTTIRDYIRKTLDQNLFLLDHYPDYIFNFEGGIKYAWMKEYYPEQYERMKDYVKKGRWHVAGASWDANDVNVPSVESQIRNIMLGQNFYRNELGVESTDIFLPDCFGFGWTLPTVANHCGLIGFSSQKLGWRHKPFYGNDRYPFPIGLWKGVDGESIMMAHGYNYGQRWNDSDLAPDSKVAKLAKESPLQKVFHYYGTGDTGGAPSIGSVAAVQKASRGNGPVKVISAESDRLFRDYLPYDKHPELPVFDGELLMDVHGTGCYTSQAAMKLYNRQNELLGDAAERGALTASILTGNNYPTEALTEAWKRFIFHQFHDDLTGTSTPRVYEFSWNDELLSLKQFSDILTDAASDVAAVLNTNTAGTPLLLFNPLGYETTDVVTVEIPAKRRPASAIVKDHTGKTVRSQVTGFSDGKATVAIEATVPAVGYAVYDVALKGNAGAKAPKSISEVENSLYSIRFDKNGDIISLTDKKTGREIVKEGEAIRLAIFTENPSFAWPAWEVIKSTLDAKPESITEEAEVALVEDGPLMKTVRITKKHGDSRFTQFVNLYEGDLAPRIDFVNSVEWGSLNSLLKAEFPLSVASEKATYDLGLGVVERGNNTDIAYEVPAQQWADLSDADYGVTILNDSRYGWDKPDDNTLRLTLLHTPKTANGYSYQDHQDLGLHEFTYSLIPHQGKLNRPEATRSGERLNQRVKAFIVPKSKGTGRSISLAHSDSPDVSVKALKGAEDGNGIVVRVYETAGKASEANIIFSREIKKALMADGTEKPIGNASINGNKLNVSLKPNGVATYRIYFDTPATTASSASSSIDLPLNRKAMTWNGYRQEGGLNGGYSFAAEIMPEKITSAGVDFSMVKDPTGSALACGGDTILLPEGSWNRLHLLMTADTDNRDIPARINIGNVATELTVPSYTGFIGQWGHDGHTEGYMKEQRVAYAGTHRHSPSADEPHELTYLFHYTLDVPAGAKSIVLPDDPRLLIFAATATNGKESPAIPAHKLFRTSNRPAGSEAEEIPANILRPEMIVACSGHINDREKPEFLLDGNNRTKWCDVSSNPPEMVFDLGKVTEINGWTMLNAGEEDPSYVTSACYILGRDSKDEDWHTIDAVAGNKRNLISRRLSSPAKARYVKLMLTAPTQESGVSTARIYEFGLY